MNRDIFIKFRVSTKEKADMFRWAKKAGKTLSEYFRDLHHKNKGTRNWNGWVK